VNNWWYFPLNLLVGQSPYVVFWVTLAFCWSLSYVVFILVGIIGESRWVSMNPITKQFWGHSPGDIFLGITTALLYTLITTLPSRDVFVLPFPLVLVVAITGIMIGRVFHGTERNAYPMEALASPTKIYHDFWLVPIYFTVSTSALVYVFEGVLGGVIGWAQFGLVLIGGVVWLLFNGVDMMLATFRSVNKAKTAHTSYWGHITRSNWKLMLQGKTVFHD
jgi:hypothetical protein